MSADTTTILWVPSAPSTSVLISRYTSSFTAISGAVVPPPGSVIAADKVDGAVLYAAAGRMLYVTRDAGQTWAVSGEGFNGTAVGIAVSPGRAGE